MSDEELGIINIADFKREFGRNMNGQLRSEADCYKVLADEAQDAGERAAKNFDFMGAMNLRHQSDVCRARAEAYDHAAAMLSVSTRGLDLDPDEVLTTS